MRQNLIVGLALFISLLAGLAPADAAPLRQSDCPRVVAERGGITVQGGYEILLISGINPAVNPMGYVGFITDTLADSTFPKLIEPRCVQASFSPDGRYLAASVAGIRILDTTTWEEVPIPALDDTSSQSYNPLVWDVSGRYLAYEDNFRLFVLDLETQETTQIFEPPANPGTYDWTILDIEEFSPDGAWLVTQIYYYEGSSQLVLNAQTGERALSEYSYAESAYTDVFWHPDQPALLGLTAYPAGMGGDPVSLVYWCALDESPTCDPAEIPGQLIGLGWTADDTFLIQEYRDSSCFTLDEPGGDLLPADCDTPLIGQEVEEFRG